MSTRELTRPDTTMPYWVHGPAHAPTVVFLHGATVDHRSWDPQVEALRHRYRTVTPDLRGHGSSPDRQPFDVEAAVQDVLALLDVLGRPVALVGLSLGGNIAQEVVFRAPERVDALVVADSTCTTAARRPVEKLFAIGALAPMALMPDELFRRRAARAVATEPTVRDYVRASNRLRSPGSVVQILIALVTALHPEPDYHLPVPTLLLHGAEDRLGDIAHGTHAWADREPRAKYVVVPEAGHSSNQDNPEAFTDALRSFLDRVLPAAPRAARTPARRGARTVPVSSSPPLDRSARGRGRRLRHRVRRARGTVVAGALTAGRLVSRTVAGRARRRHHRA